MLLLALAPLEIIECLMVSVGVVLEVNMTPLDMCVCSLYTLFCMNDWFFSGSCCMGVRSMEFY